MKRFGPGIWLIIFTFIWGLALLAYFVQFLN
jgi:hypothetical protein